MLAPDLFWLLSFCMLVPLGDCEHQLLVAAAKTITLSFIFLGNNTEYLKNYLGYFLTFETQCNSALLFRMAWPLLSESNWTFPKWRTLATIPNKCCTEKNICQ